MVLEDLLARFRPKAPSVQPTSSPDMGTQPLSGDPNAPPMNFKDNFSSPSPPFRTEPLVSPMFGQQNPQQVFPGQFQSQQFQPQQQQQGQGASEERLARIEEKLKLISDKIDLMSQQVSVVWEMERRKMQ
ncbi:MAG: hypothetical protein V1820_06735 [archaeon]